MEIEKREYPELAGKEILYIDRYGVPWTGVIVACDYHLGYTVIAKDAPEIYLICAHGPLSPTHKEWYEENPEQLAGWDKDWKNDVKYLLFGKFEEKNMLTTSIGSNTGSHNCSFSQ